MPKLVTIFEQEVSVPQWDYCNDQKDNISKGQFFCNFMSGNKDERHCKLFGGIMLYSAYDWVKKCDECLKKSKVGHQEAE